MRDNALIDWDVFDWVQDGATALIEQKGSVEIYTLALIHVSVALAVA